MFLDYPAKRYRYLPKTLLAGKEPEFLDKKGRSVAFDRRKILTLRLYFRSNLQALDFLAEKALPKAKKQRKLLKRIAKAPAKRKKPAKSLPKPRKQLIKGGWEVVKAPAKFRKRSRKDFKKLKRPTIPKKSLKAGPRRARVGKPRALWLSCSEVYDRLEKKYDSLEFDKRAADFKGWYYDGKGSWHGTIWPTKHIQPQMSLNSCFLFAIFDIPEYDGREPIQLFGGAQMGWNTTPEWILKTFAENSDEKVLNADGSLREQTRLESLLHILFLKMPAMAEFVGIRFSRKIKPMVYRNPKKKKRKK